nr:zonadhesin 2 [Ephestia kuehniella]
MWKLLLLAAILANTHFVASGLSSSQSSSSSSSSSSSQSSSFSEKCAANETYVDCPAAQCRPMTCSQVGFPVACPALAEDDCPGNPGCICDAGYVWNDKGVCIPATECPSCGGDKNARFGCGVNCNKHCSDIGVEPKACILICYTNRCDCKDGFYLNSKGKCVKPDQCDTKPTCPKHEVFSNCTNGDCEAQNCSQLGYPVPCVKINPDECQKGCVCDEGYLRAENGTCIPKSQCPSCGGDENAQAGCGVNCNRHCSDIGEEPKACIEICYENACDCKDGFYLNSDGKCVKPDQCNKRPSCPKNEVFSNCTNGGCDARNCSQLGYPVPCVKLDPASCKKGCVCAEGYLRDAKGTCILKSKCPTCGGDPNAQSGCGVNCGKHCSTKPRPCLKICKVNACDCKDGFVFDDNINKCVKRKDCTPTCEVNEVYSNCTNGGAACSVRNCSQLGFPIAFSCPKIDPATCKKGCLCANGYLRADNGTCIPRNECPSCGGDPNAKSGCGVHCGNTCATYRSKPVACPLICQLNGCDCKPNYVYDSNTKKCVLPKDCTQTPPATNTTDVSTGYCTEDDTQDCLTSGNIDFTLDFLHQVIKVNSGKSIVMSPFSVLFPLAELALATNPGESFLQLMSALHLNTKDQIRNVFPALISLVQAQKEVVLDLAAKTYVSDNAQLNKTFEDDSVQVFDSKAETLDFTDTKKAADTINNWVDEITKGLIQDLVSPNMFSEYTRIVLVNAIYFLGNWETQFNPNYTSTQDFHITEDKTVPVQMMFRNGSFKYADSSSLGTKILEIPYKGGNFSYVLFLPDEIDGYTTVAEKIKDSDVLNEALDSLSYSTCELYLPRHNITTTIDLTDILAKLNITDIFDSEQSDLSGILDNNEKLSVTSAIHKANIGVNEIGTEAAAATGLVGTATAIINQIVVRADHPFLFLLMLNRNPLFCGVYAGN